MKVPANQLTQRLASGEEHGLINTIGNSVAEDGMKRFAEKDRPSFEKKKKEDETIVYRMYLHSKQGTERLERPYMNWAGQPITMWKFIHGHEYWLPKGLVDDVNKQPPLPQRSEVLDANGVPSKMEGKGEKLHRFVQVE